MNERIEELAEQADDYAHKEYAKRLFGYEREYFFRQKFADLIIRECIDVLRDNEICGNHVSHALRVHFGVEDEPR